MSNKITLGIFSFIYIFFFFQNPNAQIGMMSVGILANFLVVSLNKWKMPVLTEDKSMVNKERHCFYTKRTKLKFLSDIIQVRFPLPFNKEYISIISMGDVLIILGAVWGLLKL